MLCSCPSGISREVAKLMSAMWVLSTCGILLCLPCHGQQNAPTPQPVEVSGPTKVTLGNIAELNIPAGFHFADAQNARALLEKDRKGVPKGLLGRLRSDAGGWEIRLSFDETGYVKGETADLANDEAILKSLAEHSASTSRSAGKLSWKLKPQYNPQEQTLEWATLAETGAGDGSETTVTVQLLARRGVLRATAVCKGFADLEELRQLLVKGISFKEAQRYADFQQGDPCATGGLGTLVAYNNFENEPGWEGLSKAMAMGIWGGVAVLALGGTFALALMFKRARRREPARPDSQAPVNVLSTTEAKASTSAAGAKPVLPVATKPTFQPAPAPAVGRKNAVLAKKIINDSNSRKKRAFDYNRYFADLMSTVSSHGPAMEAASANGYSLDRNGNPVPIANGNGNSSTPDGSFNVNSEMISHQTTLIEEQRRLIQEQTKLIEEKSKLIAEKNQLLKMQSELIESKLL